MEQVWGSSSVPQAGGPRSGFPRQAVTLLHPKQRDKPVVPYHHVLPFQQTRQSKIKCHRLLQLHTQQVHQDRWSLEGSQGHFVTQAAAFQAKSSPAASTSGPEMPNLGCKRAPSSQHPRKALSHSCSAPLSPGDTTLSTACGHPNSEGYQEQSQWRGLSLPDPC